MIEQTADRTEQENYIEKLKQKIENYINLHKGTLIERHRQEESTEELNIRKMCTKAKQRLNV